jgi:outer membrane protein TolC
LEDLLHQALDHSPAVQAAHARWRGVAAGAEAADAWADPHLTYGYFVEPVETRVGPQEHKVMLNQAIPWFGTTGARRRAAEADADALFHAYAQALQQTVFEVKSLVYERAYLEQAMRLTRENIELVRRLEGVAQARLRGGGAAGAAVKAQLELGRLEDRLISLGDRLRPLETRMNAALGRAHGTPHAWPEDLPYADAFALGGKALAALSRSPVFRELKARVEGETERVDLARRTVYPEMVVGLDYVVTGDAVDPSAPDSGQDAVMAKIGLRLPLWLGKNRAELARARYAQTASEQRLQDGLNRLRVDLDEMVYACREAYRQAALYRDTLLPQAEQAMAMAEEAYRAGTSGFLDLVDAQRLLLELQLNYQRARADAEIRRAEIDMITGQAGEAAAYLAERTDPHE